MYAETIGYPLDIEKQREEIPDVFGPTGKAAENVDLMPRMRAITTLWDAGRGPLYNWAVYANDGTFVLNI